ncbi:MAG: GNAT family N-acetyltransferase [Actinobacteria bacterium]|nr:GNAT family N-acetyltransferase [Actinomycetota bacterium]
MNNFKNQNSNSRNIRISNLKPEDLDSYLKIEFDAFFEKLKFIFGSNKDAAYSIIKSEITANIDTGRYYNAVIDGKIVGIVEIVTRENSKSHTRNFWTFVKYLGFFRAFKAFILTFMETPKLDIKTIYIDNVTVDINSRRKGIAKKMLSFAEDFAKRNGKSALKLWVAGKNKNACSLYKKLGFNQLVARSSRIAERYTGYRDWIYMKKEIL